MAMFISACPGAIAIKGTPTIKIKRCPECGTEIEVFSNNTEEHCPKCGFTVYNDAMACVMWCKYARDCVGDETYFKFRPDAEGAEEYFASIASDGEEAAKE
jgi:DNA-directed RNA polymerase subunit RPC12/RpoP